MPAVGISFATLLGIGLAQSSSSRSAGQLSTGQRLA
jgi:hypothetical protein